MLLVLLLLLFLLQRSVPQTVLVPKVTGTASAFDAQSKLIDSGLRLDPDQKTQVDDTAAAGTVLRQIPEAGRKVDRGSAVTILVATGSGQATVPDISGGTVEEAEKRVRAADLTLGQASPQPIDPDARIQSQIPAAGETVKVGTPVSLFYAPTKEAGGDDPAVVAGPGDDTTTDETDAGDPASTIVVPISGRARLSTFATRLSDLSLVPVARRVFDELPRDRVIATKPPAGATARKGDKVNVLVSAGFPRIAFSDGDDVLLVDGASGKRLGAVAASPRLETDPAWAPDARRVAYVSDGRIRVADLSFPDRRPRAVTDGDDYADLAWSPRGDVLAASRGPAGDTDLCLVSAEDRGPASCKTEPTFELALSAHWAPDGRSILAVGRRTGSATSGIVRWTTTEPFSADARDWSAGEFVSDVTGTDRDVAHVALSPDGARLAVAARHGADEFRLWLTDADDLALERAKRTSLRACKVTWRGDGLELALKQADRDCHEIQGALVRVDPAHLRETTQVAPKANDVGYEPIQPADVGPGP